MCYVVPVGTRLHIVLSDETVADIDRVRGDVPRSAWIRRLIVTELFGPRAAVSKGGALEIPSPTPAPAEQPEALAWKPGHEMQARFREAGVRPAREFRPYPKPGGKK